MAAIQPIEVRIRDMDRVRLFVHELDALRDDMRVGASPFAERLERALGRFVDGGDDEGEGESAGTISFEVVHEEVISEACPKCGHVG